MNLIENILSKASNTASVTHILSYDLISKDITFYNKLDEFIIKTFPWSAKRLETFWELNTQLSCASIKDLILSICWNECNIRVYRVSILDFSKHPNNETKFR